MHIVNIPKWATERVVERHGTAHPYADLDPARTALVVVDMQNGFMVEGLAHALCKTVMVSDANAAGSDEEHNASLASFYVTFGDLMDTSYVIERLEANVAARIAAE